MGETDRLQRTVERQATRMERARRERHTLLSQTVYIGTLGMMMVVPIVGGAYLGRWIDSMASGYSMRWTLSLMLVGVVVGAINVYLLIRE